MTAAGRVRSSRRRQLTTCILPAAGALNLACARDANFLRPAGEGAQSIATLTWALIALSAIVTIAVIALTLYAVAHKTHGTREHSPEGDRRSIRWIVIGGGIVPAVILVVFFAMTLVTLAALTPVQTRGGLLIEVTGTQWWWEVRYIDAENRTQQVVAANEIHIPAGPRVPVHVRSTDVIHSLWVPELQGKIDLVPGRTNVTWLQANAPGVFRGRCAEFCGLQHAHMELLVIAHDSADFAAWLAHQAQPASASDTHSDSASTAQADTHSQASGDTDGHAHQHGGMDGAQVFLRAGCGYCHTIRGTPARGTVGPDLTHVGSRRELAAGTLPNTRGHLMGWIANPQQLKPGTRMPRLPLAPDELHALAHYLGGLR